MNINYNADPFTKDNENNPLIYMLTKELVKQFDTGENYYDKINVLDYLLKIGFYINETNEDGKTPLMEC